MSGEISKAPGRRHHRKLRGRAKRAEKLASKLTQRLALPEPDVDELAGLVGDLRPVLAKLRASTLAKNGPHAPVIASGIADLSTAFEKLVRSKQTTDPKSAMQHLKQGKRALDEANRKARKAGDAWPL